MKAALLNLGIYARSHPQDRVLIGDIISNLKWRAKEGPSPSLDQMIETQTQILAARQMEN